MFQRRLLGVLGMTALLAMAGCSDSSPDTTVGAVEASTTTSTTTTTTEPATTTTTLSDEVAAPASVDNYHFDMVIDASIRQPGSTDLDFQILSKGDWTRRAEYTSQTTLVGTTEVGNTEIITIGGKTWLKESPKPWRSVEAVPKTEELIADRDAMYAGLSTRDWTLDTLNGQETRKYQFDGLTHRMETWFDPDFIFDLETARDMDMSLWIDVETNHMVQLTLDAVVPEAVFGDTFTEAGDAIIDLRMVAKFDDINIDPAPDITSPPDELAGIPEGFFWYEDADFGARLLVPIEWELVPSSEPEPGFIVSLVAAPEPPEDDIVVLLAVEDLASYPGLTVDEYAELTLDFIAIGGELDVLVAEPDTVSGVPARRHHALVSDQFGATEVRTVTVVSGSSGYSLRVYGESARLEAATALVEEIFGSFEFYVPEDPSA